jgi:condensin complex subunit 3
VLTFLDKIFIPTFEKLSEMRKELDDDDEMVSMAQVGGMFLDWTDPQKAM